MLKGNIGELYNLIIGLEAKQIFDSENLSEFEAKAIDYLHDLQSIYNVLSPSNPNKKCVACVLECHPKHMPDNYGFNYNSKNYFDLETLFINQFIHNGVTDLWVDMSQGVSIAAAKALIRLKRAGFDVSLNLAIPNKKHPDAVFGTSKAIYDFIRQNADKEIFVSTTQDGFNTLKEAKRYIISQSNLAYVSNTSNEYTKYIKPFVDFAKSKNVEIVNFDLKNLRLNKEEKNINPER